MRTTGSLLWVDCKEILKRDTTPNWFRLSEDSVKGIDDFIRQLSEPDPESQGFRYSRTKKGDPSLPTTLTNINIAAFAGEMDRLCTFLDDWDSYLDTQLELSNEAAAAYEKWIQEQSEDEFNEC